MQKTRNFKGGIFLKKNVIKIVSFLFILLTMMVGCNNKKADEKSQPITKEEAYTIYYNTIKKFVPELMTDPQECDVEIKTRDEVTFLTEHFVRNTNVKIMSQNSDGKLQYYLLNEFPEANKMDFYCINNNRFYNVSCKINEKGNLEEWGTSHIPSFTFQYLNTPLFKLESISSFESIKKNSDIEVTFIVEGNSMDEGYGYRVMQEILPNVQKDKLDDVKIVLTMDKYKVAKTMSTEISMSKFYDNGELQSKKTLNMDFVFNKLDNVDFDLEKVVSQYVSNVEIAK